MLTGFVSEKEASVNTWFTEVYLFGDPTSIRNVNDYQQIVSTSRNSGEISKALCIV